MIIFRYLTKEVFSTLLAVTLVLLLIFLSDQLVRYLGYAASGKIAAHILFRLMGYEIPYLLALLLPLGLYLGIMLAYGRLYTDNEMRVLQACGLSTKALVNITGILALLVTLVIVVLTLWVNPWLSAKKEKLLIEDGSSIVDTLIPGRLFVTDHGNRVVYVEKVSRDHRTAENLFIADQAENTTKGNRWVVLAAAHGAQVTNPKTQEKFVVASDGYRYEGIPGQNNYQVIQFKKYTARLPEMSGLSKRKRQSTISSKKLLQNYFAHPDQAAELQWRISIPISALLLAFLAIPLCQIKPRQGRFSMLLPAILLYVIYMNLLFVGRNLIEQKLIPLGVGLWWVHLLALGGIGLFIMIRSGRWIKQ